MNIKTAQRLYELRKKHGYSQEELADKLGVSRQAVSKWERSESSPDTDNLIELAKLYGVTLDELLNGDEAYDAIKDDKKADNQSESQAESTQQNQNQSWQDTQKEDIHITSEDGEGIHITDDGIVINTKKNKYVVDDDGVVVDGTPRGRKFVMLESVVSTVWSLIIVATYLILGFTLDVGFSHCWFLFILIPVVPSLVKVIEHKRLSKFAFPVLVAAIYCALGMFMNLWHPLWVIFFSIPVYYSVVCTIEKSRS